MGSEETAGIQVGIAEILVGGAVVVVGSRFEHEVSAVLSLIHGRRISSLYLKLVQGFHRDTERKVANLALQRHIGDRHALDVDVLGIGLRPINISGGIPDGPVTPGIYWLKAAGLRALPNMAKGRAV
jgi:hypothetical protein